jgi:hypothetical protein
MMAPIIHPAPMVDSRKHSPISVRDCDDPNAIVWSLRLATTKSAVTTAPTAVPRRSIPSLAMNLDLGLTCDAKWSTIHLRDHAIASRSTACELVPMLWPTMALS